MSSTDDAAAAASSASAAASSAAAAATNAAVAVSNASVLSTLTNSGASTNRIFATTAAGIASTTSGNYFYVPSTNAQGAFDVWMNNAGVALLVTTVPNLLGMPLLAVQQAATHASLPASPAGLYLVLADETRGGGPSLYYFWSTHCIWFAALQVA